MNQWFMPQHTVHCAKEVVLKLHNFGHPNIHIQRLNRQQREVNPSDAISDVANCPRCIKNRVQLRKGDKNIMLFTMKFLYCLVSNKRAYSFIVFGVFALSAHTFSCNEKILPPYSSFFT